VRVLVVEDEERLAAGLRVGLVAEGFAVDVAYDGTDGLWMAREHAYDAIVLDIMLPGVNGFEVCATLRSSEVWTPILMLTARDGEHDEVAGLDAGADDYLTKPFSYAVLLAHVRALIRREVRERPAGPGRATGVARCRRGAPDRAGDVPAGVPHAPHRPGRVQA
jgi:two-component system OmpR family response regulator